MRTMVDANIMPSHCKMLVRHPFPPLAKVSELHVGRRQVIRQQPFVFTLDIGLVTKAAFANLPRGHKHMGMMVTNIARVVRRMNGKIHRCAIAIRQVLCQLSRCLYAYSNATGRCFRLITGHPFQFDAGRDSDAKPDSLRLLWAHLMFVFDRVAGQAGVVPASGIFLCLRKLSPESSMR